ncbi:hypothetical protein N0B51_06290 [Tsuneonella sp. YG55]|uniref:SH3 domain-containing protein n=1 Tax=Tsuneonella litorea TaxID=2976475 RepID=A0A9X3A7N1_9SPHN|nr:hypothetical protein [Tsuneonella litorea]MCT2558586.1 hypothetical protein [Tsuneonella litorea]
MWIPDRKTIFALALATLAAACSQENAPSEAINKAADKVVKTVDGSASDASGRGEYAPRDDCGDTPGAENFRRQLGAAVEARDADRLAALAAPDVKLDFGGGAGTAVLRSRLSRKEQDLWGELDDLLKLGCAVNAQGGITIPWYAAKPLEGVDPAADMLVTGEGVPVRRDADADSPEIAQVSWNFVRLVDGLQPEDDFQKVAFDGDKTGFIATDRLRSPLDYRLVASSRDGKWSFTSLVAGD